MIKITEGATVQVMKEDMRGISQGISPLLTNRKLDGSTDKEPSKEANGVLTLWKAPVTGKLG